MSHLKQIPTSRLLSDFRRKVVDWYEKRNWFVRLAVSGFYFELLEFLDELISRQDYEATHSPKDV